MRMGMRRFTRLTNGFSKKLENHGHMVALYFMLQLLPRPEDVARYPSNGGELTDHVWAIEELLGIATKTKEKINADATHRP
jgi:hypothetical protein